MKLIIEIPKEFEEQFSNDRFKDSLERILVEIVSSDNTVAGLYELELIQMLRNAMTKAEVKK